MTEVEGFTIKDYSEEVLKELEDSITKALLKCGEKAEEYAKRACPVKTGLLRNSITYALGGEAPAVTSYSSDDGSKSGSYSGKAPDDEEGKRSVYPGTNVEYAKIVELGSSSNSKRKKQPYISPAIKDHGDKYRQIIKETLGGG